MTINNIVPESIKKKRNEAGNTQLKKNNQRLDYQVTTRKRKLDLNGITDQREYTQGL